MTARLVHVTEEREKELQNKEKRKCASTVRESHERQGCRERARDTDDWNGIVANWRLLPLTEAMLYYGILRHDQEGLRNHSSVTDRSIIPRSITRFRRVNRSR